MTVIGPVQPAPVRRGGLYRVRGEKMVKVEREYADGKGKRVRVVPTVRRGDSMNGPMFPWDCGCRLGFFLGQHGEVWEKFFSSPVWLSRLPAGWSPKEGGISGAAGYYIVFDVDVLPTVEDGQAVRRLLNRMKSRR